MADRYVVQVGTALASNTGGPYTNTWDRAVVPSDGTIRTVYAVARSLTSNTSTNKVDIYYQGDAPAAGSNTATSVLVGPITLSNNNDAVAGTISQAGARVSAGGQLQLRTDASNAGSQPAFLDLVATIEIERD